MNVGQRFSPLDEELGLLPGSYTPQVQEAVTRLGSRLSYREAQEELSLLWGLEISVGSVRNLTMRYGQVAERLVAAHAEKLVEEAPVATATPEQLIMSADGAFIQLTNGEWREVKTVALGEFKTVWHPKGQHLRVKTNNISYFSRLDNADTFAQQALYEWQRRGGENAQRVAAVNDGALWIQTFIDYHCPDAIRIIDFAHACAYLAIIGKALYGAESDAFKQWFSHLRKQLGRYPPRRILASLRLVQKQHPDHPLEMEIEQAIRYLEKRQEMIDYPHFRRQQLPIGSGMVESGHKVVLQRRMKQAGMRWTEASVNPMLALRNLLCNGRWQEGWQEIEAQVRQEKMPVHLKQKQSSTQELQPSLVTEADCQRMSIFADRLAKKKRRPWPNNRWIFPHRGNFLHQN